MVARRKKAGLDQLFLAVIGVVFAFILALLPVHAFISTWGGTAIGPLLIWKSWKEIALLALVPVVVWLCVLRPDIARAMWRSWLSRIIVLYVIVTLIMSVASDASAEAVIAGLLLNLRFLAMFVLAQVILTGGAPWIAFYKKWLMPWLVGTGVVLSVLAVLQVTIAPKDFLSHFGYDKNATIAPYVLVDQNPSALRAFATMRGPNTLASYLLLPLALALLMWWKDHRCWWAIGAAGVMALALGLSGSRSGWLGAAVMVAFLAGALLPRVRLRSWLKFGTLPLIAGAVLLFWLSTVIPAVRLAVFHSGGNSQTESLTEGSSDKHWQATLHGVQSAINDSLGSGVGTAGPASFYNANAPADIPENYFVQIAQETGLLGLALFVAISVLVWRNLWRARRELWPCALLASFVGLNVVNLFLHGWADDPTAMTWWALAGLFITPSARKKVQST